MKVRRLVVLGVVIMALAACRGERSSLTGSYGSGVLSGQVVLNGIQGSPEGVEISVRDTGMTMTLNADGRFAFSGVPENAILDFRRADGIEASLAVNGTGRPVIVALGKRDATRGSAPKRGNKLKDKVEFEGTIKSASETEIVVLTSHKEEILIGLSSETVIRHGNTAIDPKDLKEGMRVHVRARKVIDPVTEVLSYTAELVIVQEGDDDDGEDDQPKVTEYEGTIVSASATELVIFDSHRNEVTFVLGEDTVIRKGNKTVDAADLIPGQRVHVKATVAEDGTATATLVILQNTQSNVSVNGTVLGVSGSDITVTTKKGDQWTVQTNASTRIREKGRSIGTGDIEAGDSVTAKGKLVAANTILASEVEVRSKSGHP